MDERNLIKRIQGVLKPFSRKVIVGIGDDAAVCLPPKGRLLSTVDILMEGVHFDLNYLSAFDLGYKALAVSLSDIAAMGGRPLYALVSMGIRRGISEKFVEDFYRGMGRVARRHSTEVVGGNLCRSGKFFVDVTVLGEANRFITRSGARPGDAILVTGHLGDSVAGRFALSHRVGGAPSSLKRAHLRPQPRLWESAFLLENGGITSMIDISDGLAMDLHRLAQSSKVGAILEESQIPVSSKARLLASHLGRNVLDWALFGGEDYELLFTCSRNMASTIVRKLSTRRKKISLIGRVTPRGRGIQLKKPNGMLMPLMRRGWDHLKNLH